MNVCVITVPRIVIAIYSDGVAADHPAYVKTFSSQYSLRVFKGTGHNVPQEAQDVVANAVVGVDGQSSSAVCALFV